MRRPSFVVADDDDDDDDVTLVLSRKRTKTSRLLQLQQHSSLHCQCPFAAVDSRDIVVVVVVVRQSEHCCTFLCLHRHQLD